MKFIRKCLSRQRILRRIGGSGSTSVSNIYLYIYNSMTNQITNFLNNLMDLVISGSNERSILIREVNTFYKEAFYNGIIDRMCKISTSVGNPNFKHSMSYYHLRSGFQIKIINDSNMSSRDFEIVTNYIITNKPFIRKLMSYGYDTLTIKGKSFRGIQIPLKEVSDLNSFLLS